jgi:hypothetical protein
MLFFSFTCDDYYIYARFVPLDIRIYLHSPCPFSYISFEIDMVFI